ncbi:MAG: class I SAM-dependent methyltransferase [Patescibacteria group bacterium]
MKYQQRFSSVNSSVLDPDVRINKAKKIVTIIEHFFNSTGGSLANSICVDIGGSAGFTAVELSKRAKEVYVVDIDEQALEYGKKHNCAKNIHYQVGDAMRLPFRNDSISVVICNQVYEHVPSSEILMREIYRILKENGICYFGAGNRFKVMEPHYHLPFLSWLPKSLANFYMKSVKKGEKYYENHLSYFNLKKIIAPFTVIDYTYRVLSEPERFFNTDVVKSNSLLTKIPRRVYACLKPLSPGFIFILKKQGS